VKLLVKLAAAATAGETKGSAVLTDMIASLSEVEVETEVRFKIGPGPPGRGRTVSTTPTPCHCIADCQLFVNVVTSPGCVAL